MCWLQWYRFRKEEDQDLPHHTKTTAKEDGRLHMWNFQKKQTTKQYSISISADKYHVTTGLLTKKKFKKKQRIWLFWLWLNLIAFVHRGVQTLEQNPSTVLENHSEVTICSEQSFGIKETAYQIPLYMPLNTTEKWL